MGKQQSFNLKVLLLQEAAEALQLLQVEAAHLVPINVAAMLIAHLQMDSHFVAQIIPVS